MSTHIIDITDSKDIHTISVTDQKAVHTIGVTDSKDIHIISVLGDGISKQGIGSAIIGSTFKVG